MAERRPTIHDVARRAGVSKSTVSLVLRGSPAVAAGTVARVRAAIGEAGYVYNRAAANLRLASASLIGVVINDLRNPFFTEFATALQMALAARGYAAVLANTGEDPAVQAQVVTAMIEHGVAGLVVSPAYGSEASFAALARAGVPAMQVLRRVGDTGRFPFAAPDYAAGGRLATEHLLARGARQVAFVGGPEGRAVTQERMAGYLEVLAREGRTPLPLPGQGTRAFGRVMAARLAQEHPEVDAVLCFNDLVALGLLSGCARIGRPVGQGLRVVGFDDIEECADAWPALSSVRCGIAGFGEDIAATLLGWIEAGEVPPPERRSPVELVVRASSG